MCLPISKYPGGIARRRRIFCPVADTEVSSIHLRHGRLLLAVHPRALCWAREADMTTNRAYLIDGCNPVLSYRPLEADSDAGPLTVARQILAACQVEVW